MKRAGAISLVVTTVSLLAALPSAAQLVVEEELRGVRGEVVFINYEGPYDRIDTADEIKGLGYFVAASLRQSGRRGAFLGKYSVVRAVDPAETGRFDADIFSIDADARVDHIDNVRRILGGYLEGAFLYSAEDARTLARFATVYNAVHRGDLEFYAARYKALVLSYLNRQNAGLSTRYYEWPGATRLLIPLTPEAAEGRLSALDTSELSREEVIEEMRRQPDMGLEDRKDMVELKEREVDERREVLEEQEERLAEARAELAEREAELAEARTADERRPLAEEVARQEAEVREREARATETEEQIRRREEEIVDERQRIISDERSMDERGVQSIGAALVTGDELYYLKVRAREPSGSISGTLSIIDPREPAVSVTSPFNYIRGRAYYFLRDTILVVANEAGPASPVRLLALDPRSLREVRRSGEEVYAESFVLIQGGAIYAVISAAAEYRLARFDEQLRLAGTSSVPVDRDSSFSLFENRLFVNSPSRSILILDRTSLGQIGGLP